VSDPKHPTKVLIVLKNGCITGIYLDRNDNLKFIIADYDTDSGDSPNLGVDTNGEERYLYENAAWIDTKIVRDTINKRGNPIYQGGGKNG